MLVRARLLPSLLAMATLACFATAAHAQVPMTGEWFMNRGPLVDIPVNGGPSFCGGPPSTGCLGNLRPATGGIAGSGTVMVLTPGSTPSDPARFSVPTGVFTQMNPAQHTHVSIIPTVVQLDTQFSLNGPASETGGPNVDRVFEKSAWTVQGHTGRLALSFGWCPGVGGP
jgi:hypothetical protein